MKVKWICALLALIQGMTEWENCKSFWSELIWPAGHLQEFRDREKTELSV